MNRLLTSILIFMLSIPALFFYVLFLMSIFNPSLPIVYPWPDRLFMLAGMVAWGVLFYMSILWVKHLPISQWISALGTLLAIIGLIPFIIRLDAIVLLALPAFLFTIYLCYCSWSTAKAD
ncbi:hypothetical protein ACSJMR_09965 [Acinetobacter pecorum]|uniref:hypothetical protein n=1 Tax=Acinetobacter pecorum TaxID=2762215 RepID=UPI00148F40FC